MILAHDWDILGDRRKERWPLEKKRWADKRELRVSIFSFVGTAAIGAKHYEARVQEEDRQWWSESDGDWVKLSCDMHSRGLSMEGSFLFEEDAIRMARMCVEILIKRRPGQYRLIWSGPGKPKGAW